MKCKNCEFWAGEDDSVVAVCRKITTKEKYFNFKIDSIALRPVYKGVLVNEPFAVTGADFFCASFKDNG